MTGRCKTCKHWAQDESYGNLPVGRCNKAVELWKVSVWKKDADGDYVNAIDEDICTTGMFVQDGSDYMAMLFTKDTFGCVEYDL